MNTPDIARLRELLGTAITRDTFDDTARAATAELLQALPALLDRLERAETWPRAFERRVAIYRQKMDEADPFAKGDLNQFDKYQFVIEAYEYLAAEAGA